MDWLARTLELIGVLMIGNLCRHGFLVCIICNFAWIYVAMKSGVHGLILVSAVMGVCNTRNYFLWKRRGL